MMNVLTRNEIQKLANIKKSPAISIFMQTGEKDYAVLRERFRNLLIKTKASIGNRQDVKSSTKHEALGKAFELLHNREWWARADKTAAVYVGKDFLRAYHLADSYKESVTIATEFDIVPLLDSIADGEFHVLALSQRKLRLLWSNRHAVEEVELDDLPPSLQQIKDERKQSEISRSSYYLEKAIKPDIFRYLKQANKIITPYMHKTGTPLVLIGLPHIVALYQSLNNYNHIVKKYVAKNPDGMDLLTLRNRAWTALKPQARRDQRLAYSQFERLLRSQPQRVAKGLAQVMDAIAENKVQTLFINTNDKQWGSLNATHAVDLHERPQPGDVNLLNMLARSAVSANQHVFSLPDNMHELQTAAILRAS